jgi:hypothetical protein
MIESSVLKMTASPSRPADLLPWADPYIQQLFAEAALMESSADSVHGDRSVPTGLPRGQQATGEAVFSGDAWMIRLRPNLSAHTRRTGSEHWLGRCEPLST